MKSNEFRTIVEMKKKLLNELSDLSERVDIIVDNHIELQNSIVDIINHLNASKENEENHGTDIK
tara:strand:- start:15709 stop:15900 length:192 start_codon:yes stop_codon:yes gene_type:complete